jgi:hypothetical protein
MQALRASTGNGDKWIGENNSTMKAWLIMQEGPGAGHSHTLDPFKQASLSLGRSSECDITLADHRASRHHADLRWNGRQWEVVDQGSTNGTYVNGMQVHQPYELRPGDRVTIGETTMVLRDSQPAPAKSPDGRVAQDAIRTAEGQAIQSPAARSSPRPKTPAGGTIALWLAQGVATVAVVCLGAGALLPWIKISGSLSQDLQPLVQGIAELVASLSGSDSVFNVSQQIGGLDGYGRLTLGIAVISTAALTVDIFFYRSVVPGIVYLVSGIVAAGAIGFDLLNYYRYYDQLQDLTLLLGIQLGEVVQVFDQFIDLQITPMVGLYLTGAGLILLLAAGIGRLLVAFRARTG